MKLISINIARSIWLGQLTDLNPKGRNLYPVLLPLLIDSYKFKGVPKLGEKLDETAGIRFEQGEFRKKIDEPIMIFAFTIFSDGLVVDTRSSTQDSDEFLKEILTRLHDEFNLPHYSEVFKRLNYLSEIHVSMNKPLELFNPKLKEVSKYLSDNVVGFEKPSFEIGGISFWPDQKIVRNPIPLSIERAINIPFSEKRYFSRAPLQTEQHLELLNKFEEILGV